MEIRAYRSDTSKTLKFGRSFAPLAGTMQSEKGSATVPVALFGVSPNRWGKFHSPMGAPRRIAAGASGDADDSGRDDRAPHLQLHRSGLAGNGFMSIRVHSWFPPDETELTQSVHHIKTASL
jgi:hypothetical protein